MASTNKTANLELSQFVGSDKPDWLTDYNSDMLNIDNSYGEVSANAEVAARNAQIASDNAAAAISKADDAVSQISGVVDTVTRAEEVADRAEGVANNALTIANNTAALAQDAVGYANDALAKAASAKEQSESALASAATAVTTANEAKSVAESAADDVAGAVDKADAAKTAADAAQAAADDVGERVDDIESLIPSNASASNKLATAADVPSAVTVDSALSVSSENPVQNRIITGAINNIESLIPSNASASNKLATAADIQGGGSDEAVFIKKIGDSNTTNAELIGQLWADFNTQFLNSAPFRHAVLRGDIDFCGFIGAFGLHTFGHVNVNGNDTPLLNSVVALAINANLGVSGGGIHGFGVSMSSTIRRLVYRAYSDSATAQWYDMSTEVSGDTHWFQIRVNIREEDY